MLLTMPISTDQSHEHADCMYHFPLILAILFRHIAFHHVTDGHFQDSPEIC